MKHLLCHAKWNLESDYHSIQPESSISIISLNIHIIHRHTIGILGDHESMESYILYLQETYMTCNIPLLRELSELIL